MKIDKISAVMTPKTTGYMTVAALGLSTLSGVSKNQSLKKYHKSSVWITLALTALHISLIEYSHYIFRKQARSK